MTILDPARPTLYLVATPIGNLGDVTRRATEVLGAVDAVAAEDTRHSRKLLEHLGIRSKPLYSIESHLSASRLDRLIERIVGGMSTALVTDAGTPGVSDPGARVVRAARAAGIRVVVVPGPSALTAAVATSGLVEGPFFFAGFLPRQGAKRRAVLERICRCSEPVVLFESPLRVRATLADLAREQPNRKAAICRELTKLHEQVVLAPLSVLAAREDPWRGEIVLVLSASAIDATEEGPLEPEPDDAELSHALRQGKTVRDLVRDSGARGERRRALYRRLVALSKQTGDDDGHGQP